MDIVMNNKIVPEDGEDYAIDDLLHSSTCVCGKELEWHCDGDIYYTDCECGRHYDTCTSTVSVYVSEPDTDDKCDGDDE